MNYERAKIIALLSGTPLVRCTSGGQVVYCRLLSADEVKALKHKQLLWITHFTSKSDMRLLQGYHMIPCDEGALSTYVPGQYFAFRTGDGDLSTPHLYLLYQTNPWLSPSRVPVEPLEDDEDD